MTTKWQIPTIYWDELVFDEIGCYTYWSVHLSFVQPAEYEPPFFASTAYEDSSPWVREPLKMNVGHVDSNYYRLAIKVWSRLLSVPVDLDALNSVNINYSSSKSFQGGNWCSRKCGATKMF